MTGATATYDFGLNSRLAVSRRFIGEEGEPVLVIDGLMRHPQALVDYAAAEVSFEPAGQAPGGYPGIRAPAPLNYVSSTVRALDPIVREAFGLVDVVLAHAECNFSLVTLPPGDLAPLQRIPHIDTVDPLQFAFLHFLCGAQFGGTAFYRHRATGFEALTAARQPVYEQARDRELAGLCGTASYIVGDTEHYEQIVSVEARFNRMLVYRSRVLHSGRIDPGAVLSSGPRRGRLTANVFVNYRPAASRSATTPAA